MTIETNAFHRIENIAQQILSILDQGEAVPGFYDDQCRTFRQVCQSIPGQIQEGRMKIAVVGVIKSGKSTLVNMLAGKDLVKRGAGAMTSVTTRIRKGSKNQAIVYFKSWDQINASIEKAIAHFPQENISLSRPSSFDMRRQADRDYLEQVYRQMRSGYAGSLQAAGPEVMMIRHAVTGFDSCRNLVQADETNMVFAGKQFGRHKTFTADADKAFFVRDVCLELYGKSIPPHIEIADCQGADATDPASLEQVMNYLDQTNLIIYCISSRNGLRRADITFINQIKKLGLLDQVLFVNNCDLTEHESIDDLMKIEAAILQDLRLLTQFPTIYSFSSLYSLFKTTRSGLKAKDRLRLELWEKETRMIQYCEKQAADFFLFFNEAVETLFTTYLGANHIGRLNVMLSQLGQRADLFIELLTAKSPKKETVQSKLAQLHLNADRLQSIVSNSIDAAIDGLKTEIFTSVDAAFSNDKMGLVRDAGQFVGSMSMDIDRFKDKADENGFNQIFYMMFQDFRRELDRYVIENINPKIMKFVRQQEEKIGSHFQSLLDSYQVDLINSGFEKQFESTTPADETQKSVENFDLSRIKEILGLELPPGIFSAHYTPKVKAGAIADFGISTITGIFSALFEKRKVSFSPGLKKVAGTMKRQTQKNLHSQNKQYLMDLKTAYFTPMIDAVTREFKKIIRQRFSNYQSLRIRVENMIDQEIEDNETRKQCIDAVKEQIEKVQKDLKLFGGQIKGDPKLEISC